MPVSRPLRAAAALVLGAAAAVGGWIALASVEPHLEFTVKRDMKTDAYEVWGIRVTARGGEAAEGVSFERVSGPLSFVTREPAIAHLNAGWTAGVSVQLDGASPEAGVIRVTQARPVARTYEVRVGR